MRNPIRLLDKLLILHTREASELLTVRERYLRFRRTLLFVMTSISFVPLTITVWLSYHEYRQLLEAETEEQLRWNAASAKRTIEAFLGELKSALRVVSNTHTCEDLSEQGRLTEIFSSLKKEYSGLVDLGVIDSGGIQVAYTGPYQLIDKEYLESDWFQMALVRQEYVSSVFLGYRRVPHFVIAISKRDPGCEEYWVLRASVDAVTLDSFIRTIGTEFSDDIFIVDTKGVLQSRSRYYSGASVPYQMTSFPSPSGISLHVEKTESGRRIQAFGYLQGTPWMR